MANLRNGIVLVEEGQHLASVATSAASDDDMFVVSGNDEVMGLDEALLIMPAAGSWG